MSIPNVVEYDDLELILGPYLRAGLTSWTSVMVDRRYPATTWTPGFAVVIRDDGGVDQTLITGSRSVGFTVIGPGYQQTKQLAERVATLMRALPDASTLPVADAPVRGPYSLDATNRAEFYLTADLIVVGHSVAL
jgi:hypothetical protein